jgi:hypothetical protein
MAVKLTTAVVSLDPAAEDRHRARKALLGLLADETDGLAAAALAEAVANLAATAEDRHQARELLLVLLAGEPEASVVVRQLVPAVARLTTTADGRRHVREVLLGLVARQTEVGAALLLADAVIQLEPTVGDFINWRPRSFSAVAELLATVRRNSALADWLSALPALP